MANSSSGEQTSERILVSQINIESNAEFFGLNRSSLGAIVMSQRGRDVNDKTHFMAQGDALNYIYSSKKLEPRSLDEKSANSSNE